MTGPLRLILFDVDGTLVDSQGSIVSAMTSAFAAAHLVLPDRSVLLSIVGLSLDRAFERLVPDADPDRRAFMAQTYKDTYARERQEVGSAATSPLYPGMRDLLDTLLAVPENILGVATGKSRRGLDALIGSHGLQGVFHTRQVADDHPSKPHPSMIETALAESGAEKQHAVMIGDTSFDMEMARSAGIKAIGVSWGYHPVSALAAADVIVNTASEIAPAISALMEKQR